MSSPETPPLVDVVFVHGLTGDAHKTWTSDVGGEFWPQWLQDDLAQLSVFTLGYPTSIFGEVGEERNGYV